MRGDVLVEVAPQVALRVLGLDVERVRRQVHAMEQIEVRLARHVAANAEVADLRAMVGGARHGEARRRGLVTVVLFSAGVPATRGGTLTFSYEANPRPSRHRRAHLRAALAALGRRPAHDRGPRAAEDLCARAHLVFFSL